MHYDLEDSLLDILTLLLSVLSKHGEDEAWRVIATICARIFDRRYSFLIEDFRPGYEQDLAKAVVRLLLSRGVIGRA